jgi:pimeloyl-ACP methyl ester carboxylesterase
VARPRLLLIPTVSQVEWRIRPQLEEWAEVATFDAPGVGDEPGTEFTANGIVDRALAELDARGWERFVAVGDEIGAAQAIRVAGRRPDAVEAIALGHPALSLRSQGDRSPLNGDVVTALVQMARTEYRSYVRALSQLTQNAYDDELADLYMERVSPETIEAYMDALFGADAQEDLEPTLRSLEAPMLLVEHEGCLMWTREGWDDVTAAFPDARTASMELKPSVNPEFAVLLREFCASLPAYSDSLAE